MSQDNGINTAINVLLLALEYNPVGIEKRLSEVLTPEQMAAVMVELARRYRECKQAETE